MVAGVGPKRWANCAGVKKWRYSGERRSETACTSAARAAGSRGLSVTVSGRAVERGRGPDEGRSRGAPAPDDRGASRARCRRSRRGRSHGGATRPRATARTRAVPSTPGGDPVQPPAATSIHHHLCVLHSRPPRRATIMVPSPGPSAHAVDLFPELSNGRLPRTPGTSVIGSPVGQPKRELPQTRTQCDPRCGAGRAGRAGDEPVRARSPVPAVGGRRTVDSPTARPGGTP